MRIIQKISVTKILNSISSKYYIKGDSRGRIITNVKPITDADLDSLVFVSSLNREKKEIIGKTKAKVIICDDSIDIDKKLLKEKLFIIVDNPRLVFLRIVKRFFGNPPPKWGIHLTASVHPCAKIDKKIYLGPFCYIGRCTIGKGTIIYGHCYIYDGVKIGKNVIIHAGCIIGADGFGYEKNEKGEWEHFPQIGGVIIEDNVEIGANTCIDRGALGNTVIGEGTKIDNLVHIAHNVVLGKRVFITAKVIIAGSTTVGDDTYIAPNVSINDRLKIGKNNFIGTGSVVTKNIPDGEIWVGSPARPIEEFRQIQRKIKNLLKKD